MGDEYTESSKMTPLECNNLIKCNAKPVWLISIKTELKTVMLNYVHV